MFHLQAKKGVVRVCVSFNVKIQPHLYNKPCTCTVIFALDRTLKEWCGWCPYSLSTLLKL